LVFRMVFISFLCDVGLAQFFVEVSHAVMDSGGAFAVFCLSGGRGNVLLSSRG
jgi:hypothetical protein